MLTLYPESEDPESEPIKITVLEDDESFETTENSGPFNVHIQGTPPDLPRGDWEHYQAQVTFAAAIKLGIPGVGTLDGNADGVVIVDQLRSYGAVQLPNGRDIYGTSVSLIVRAQGAKISTATSLPVISAHVQLGEASASAKLDVRGFEDKKFISKLLASKSLDVQSYGDCIRSLNATRAYMAKHPERMIMSYLGREIDPDVSTTALREAAVVSLVLRWVAGGGSLAEFLRRKAPVLTPADKQTARSAWSKVAVGENEASRPSRIAVARAINAVDGLK